MPGQLKFQAFKQRIPAATARALNRSIASAKTAMNRVIAEDMGLRVGKVSELIRIQNATEDALVARLYASFKRTLVVDYDASGPQPSRGKGRGVTARAGGGRVRYEDAFISTMRSGHRGVFKRAGASSRKSPGAWSRNLPIVELRRASIARVFEKHKEIGMARGQEQLVKNLASEFRFVLSRS